MKSHQHDANTNPLSRVANLISLLHIGFVLVAVLGGLLALRWRRLLWSHIAAVIWAAAVEFFGWIWSINVTPLENWLRNFVAHYRVAILYPEGLTREVQIALAFLVLLIDIIIYGWIYREGPAIPHAKIA